MPHSTRTPHDGARYSLRPTPRKSLPPIVVELVTLKQLEFIKIIEKELGWHDNPERLKGFVKRIIKAETVRTKKEGIKVIQGLKSMIERNSEKEGACQISS